MYPLRDHNSDHSEAFTCSISPPHSKTFNISLFYRPSSSSIPLFLSEFYSFTHLMSEFNIIIGDFNIATNLSTNNSKSLLNILPSSNLKLHNTYPTYKYGNTFDLLISHKSSNLLFSHSVGPCISVHNIILFTLQCLKPPHPLSLVLSAKQKSSTHTISSEIYYPSHITHPMNYLPLFQLPSIPTLQSLLKNPPLELTLPGIHSHF